MMVAGWAMTIIGSGTVIFWVLYEAIMDYGNAPIATIVGVLVVLGLMALLVPVPLVIATRRARARSRKA
jgi:hypothetical protein